MDSLSKPEFYVAVTAAVTAGATSYYTYSKIGALSKDIDEVKSDLSIAIDRASEISAVRDQVQSLTLSVQSINTLMNKINDMEFRIGQQGSTISQLHQVLVQHGLDLQIQPYFQPQQPQQGMLQPQQSQQGMLQPQQGMNIQQGMLQPQQGMNIQQGMLQPQQGMNIQQGMLQPQQSQQGMLQPQQLQPQPQPQYLR